MDGKPGLGIDLDETVVYLLPQFLEWYNERRGTRFGIADFHTYRWWHVLGTTKKRAYAEAEEYFRQEKTGRLDSFGRFNIEFVEGAEPALNLLYFFYDLHGVTNRSALLESDTLNVSSALYVEDGENGNCFPQYRVPGEEGGGSLLLPMDKIYFADRRQGKPAVCRKLGIETIIDDDPDVAQACARAGIRTMMLARPWNARMRKNPLIRRVANWQEACDLLVPGKHALPDADRASYI